MINGVINVYKEAGFTSHDVVAKMRGICGQKKIGHTGTLDPQAVGVLPVCLGSATKLCDLLTDKNKEYVTELLLGVTTDTQDMTGRILSEQTGPLQISRQQAEEVILSFQGNYDQIPPMYSALKVNGKKLCDLAREGKEVERKARTITIHEIEILSVEMPVVKMRVACSKGTYIRTLCADIGDKLHCGGAMKSLVRTKAGGFCLRDALTLAKLQKLRDQGRLEEAVWPVDSVFPDFPKLHVQENWRKLLENGNAFYPDQTVENQIFGGGEQVCVYREAGGFAGIYAFDTSKQWYRPVKMFLE